VLLFSSVEVCSVLVYLATYPRSGNSFLQRILNENFGYLASQIRIGIKSPDEAAASFKGSPKYDYGHAEGYVIPLRRKGSNSWHRMLLPIGLRGVTKALRAELAASDDVYFLKLHERPYLDYLPGERIVQIVRHPGAVLWSYFRYQCDVVVPAQASKIFEKPAPTLENVITGQVGYGDWSGYQQAWDAVRNERADQYLLLRYEDLVADQSAALDKISNFVSLPILSSKPVQFADFEKRFPGWDLRGSSEGYETFYAPAQLELLWERHGACAERYGYVAPRLDQASPAEQIQRLRQLIELAWKRPASGTLS
jgi:hypothetical protein